MIPNLRKLTILLLAVAAGATVGLAQTNSSKDKLTELFGDATVAEGKGFTIKRSQLDQAVISLKATLAARGEQIPADRMALLERQVLERMILNQALLAKATDADRAKGKEVSGKSLDQLLKRAGSEEALTRQLKAVGMTPEELRARLLDEATAEAVAERELHIEVTDAEVKKFYDDHPTDFEQPEAARILQIYFSTRGTGAEPLTDEQKAAKRTQAEAALKRVKGGEDFSKLAMELSEDPGVKLNHGEYKFTRVDQVLEELKSTAFTLNTNQVSDVIPTPIGYHILKLLERIPAQKVEFSKVADNVKSLLKQQAAQKVLPEYLGKIRKEADVQILDEKLAKVELPVANDSPAAPPADTKKPN